MLDATQAKEYGQACPPLLDWLLARRCAAVVDANDHRSNVYFPLYTERRTVDLQGRDPWLEPWRPLLTRRVHKLDKTRGKNSGPLGISHCKMITWLTSILTWFMSIYISMLKRLLALFLPSFVVQAMFALPLRYALPGGLNPLERARSVFGFSNNSVVPNPVGIVTNPVGAVTNAIGAVTNAIGVPNPIGSIPNPFGTVANPIGVVTNPIGITLILFHTPSGNAVEAIRIGDGTFGAQL